MSKYMKIVNKHAPLKKFTVKHKRATWINQTLVNLMTERDAAKKVAIRSGLIDDRRKYCSLRKLVTKLNKMKKRDYYKQRLNNAKLDGKIYAVFFMK